MDRARFLIRRSLALLLLAAVGLATALGIEWLKEAFFSGLAGTGVSWARVVGGLVLFFGGLAFLGGLIFYRDAKRNYLQPRFLKWYRKKMRSRNARGADASTRRAGARSLPTKKPRP